MDLFEAAAQAERLAHAPLAVRMRPRTLDEFCGQRSVVGEGAVLRRIFAGKTVGSLILYGPPGSGKTTLAHLIAGATQAHFESLNAVTSGVSDIRRTIDAAAERRRLYGKRTILFIDEIHRFSRSQQDALLPAVEDGTITLVGATTANPFFAINPPLLSRARVIKLEPLQREDVRAIVLRALGDKERGLGDTGISLDEAALEFLLDLAGGDARAALNLLELAAAAAAEREDRRIDVALLEAAAQRTHVSYDRTGDAHYDVASAFIKSMRGSDPDATLYWLARMLEGGEDPNFIARRILIQASEDVGNADPTALVVAQAAAATLDRVGLPEAQLALAQAAVYVATAPKSNAVTVAIGRARADVQRDGGRPVPLHLRDGHYQGARQLGHGTGYRYPHDHPDGFVPQSYWPEGMEPRTYYEPAPRGKEAEIGRRLEAWRRACRGEAPSSTGELPSAGAPS